MKTTSMKSPALTAPNLFHIRLVSFITVTVERGATARASANNAPCLFHKTSTGSVPRASGTFAKSASLPLAVLIIFIPAKSLAQEGLFLEIYLHPKLDNARVARAVVFAEERAQRAIGTFDRPVPQVIGDHGLGIVGEDVIARSIARDSAAGVSDGYRNVGARIDAGELRVVEDVEHLKPQLYVAVLIRVADVEFLENRQVGVIDARIPDVRAFAQTETADFRDDERVRIDQQPVGPFGRVSFETVARGFSPGA